MCQLYLATNAHFTCRHYTDMDKIKIVSYQLSLIPIRHSVGLKIVALTQFAETFLHNTLNTSPLLPPMFQNQHHNNSTISSPLHLVQIS
jgi:hypothetical protein